MKIRNKEIYLAITCIALLFVSCGETENRLFVVERNNLYGYINPKGDTVIDCRYPLTYTDTISKIGFVADNEGNVRCFDNRGKFLFYVFKYDNGPDYPCEGYFRIVDKNGLVGFADTLGNIIITPKYRFAYPFSDGKAKVTDTGKLVIEKQSLDNHTYWLSDKWYFISYKKNSNTLIKKYNISFA